MVVGRVFCRLWATTHRRYCSSGGYKAAVLREFNKPLSVSNIEETTKLKADQVNWYNSPEVRINTLFLIY